MWIGKGTELAGKFKKFCEAEGKQIYTALRKMNSAFAERTILSSKKEFRFMEDYGYVFVQSLTQFLTTLNFGSNCCLGLIPENVMNSIFHPFGTAYH